MGTRTLIGFAIVLVLRVIAKAILKPLLRIFDMHIKGRKVIKSSSTPVEKGAVSKTLRRRKKRGTEKKGVDSETDSMMSSESAAEEEITIVFKDWDLVGQAISKYLSYLVLALAITFIVPCVHKAINI